MSHTTTHVLSEVQIHHRWEKAEKAASLAEDEISAIQKETPGKPPFTAVL